MNTFWASWGLLSSRSSDALLRPSKHMLSSGLMAVGDLSSPTYIVGFMRILSYLVLVEMSVGLDFAI